MNTADNVVEMRSVSKGFNGVSVLKDVSFDVRRGEVHALAGGNGAGKSTLMKILQGVYQADAGEIIIGGKPATINSIQDAKAAGIGMVFQEFSLVPSLTVAQNIFLAAEPLGAGGLIDDRASVRRAKEIFAEMEVDVDPRAEVSRLGTAYWQLTEIAKALSQNAQVLIMDEPTASLARHESEALFELIDRLKQRGISIIYISHRMDEVYRLADRITILRDGRRLLTEPLSAVTPEQIVEGIVGKKIEGQLAYRERDHVAHEGAPLLEVRGLNAGRRVRDVSFSLRPGEILGLAGLMGSGRTELARALFGIDRRDSGDILIRGEKINLNSPQQAIDAGVALIPEDRRAQGLVLDHSVRDNLLLPLLGQIMRGPLLDSTKGKDLSSSLIKKFAVKVAHPNRPVRLLSGGNQQKVVIAKWLGTDPDILILDEPTAGVDIGTKSEILDMVRELASAGKAVIVISSEYPELLAVSDRVLVLKDGSVIRDIPRSDIADEEYLQLAVQGV
ncbi:MULTISPECIES: sugar ABC transporter ATP-binding protein [Paenarthrobacter]|uniref:Sugar ABC transporter ATP-binding protein n=2 Tax=Paenarthrobacter ureafaciens TaxID=37931 RepID=A0AAX3EHK5_PAEUR|nr:MULTISPECIES: sugar ABC transporter ATP-binding protein [Paenarthrobacter]NKR11943.1 sugar ABC transporter ATP-binding protein [Arthrobacter sp. M5]NKR16221.1 sugar ABC transporter ATP-binding protein [Arthrobacter sp. M6]OEH57458.1 sugar ABC transporter ATP-binding protein [Arthrobacter sp. D4]OEH58733.1 sugar ABC transporter ATP-binding protein [Arthrobacter sp. D2]MDO5866780.1 sugar ABC transporter ATP-binding protein [Paenarthrobacter sp. SD-2]